MRTLRGILFLAVFCLADCWLIGWYFDPYLSGVVINAITGKPVPNVEVRFRFMNSSGHAAQTDEQGRFAAKARRSFYDYCVLYAA
jgi:hypothetical protein